MNEERWDELQRLWTSMPAGASPVARELERMRKQRVWWLIGTVIEIAVATAGIAVGVWALTRGHLLGVSTGASTIVFTLVVSALSVRARKVPRARLEDPVAQAVADSVRYARRSVQLAAATIWAVGAGIGFAAAICIVRGLLGPDATAAGYIVIGIVNTALMLWLFLAFAYYRKRSTDLARLEAIANSLELE
jgi:hypothetical protein